MARKAKQSTLVSAKLSKNGIRVKKCHACGQVVNGQHAFQCSRRKHAHFFCTPCVRKHHGPEFVKDLSTAGIKDAKKLGELMVILFAHASAAAPALGAVCWG
eukprot:tig00020553_g10621.t1